MSATEIRIATRDEASFVCDQLQTFNASKIGNYAFDPIWLACTEGQKVIAGLVGEVVFGWFNISVVWVSEEARNRGVGSAILRAGEEQAQHKGASYASLDTFDWQAVDFYRKHGYEEFARLVDCPPGHQRFYMKKVIA